MAALGRPSRLMSLICMDTSRRIIGGASRCAGNVFSGRPEPTHRGGSFHLPRQRGLPRLRRFGPRPPPLPGVSISQPLLLSKLQPLVTTEFREKPRQNLENAQLVRAYLQLACPGPSRRYLQEAADGTELTQAA